MAEQSRKRTGIIAEIVAAIVLGLLALAAFGMQASIAERQLTQRETALFGALQFLLTVGFTWLSTRALSRRDFEDSLRRFAIGAYRRIADIDRMTRRMQSETRNMLAQAGETEARNLAVIEAIATDTCQVVRSSISDWGDVIGDELLAIERISRLEQEKELLEGQREAAPPDEASSSAKDQKVTELKKSIEALVLRLPPRLQLDAVEDTRKLRRASRAAEWLTREHRKQRGLTLSVVTGDIYRHDRDVASIQPSENVQIVKLDRQGGLDVTDAKGAVLGRLQNNTPLDYDAFAEAMLVCYGECPIPARVLRLKGSERRGKDQYAWFEIQIAREPQAAKRPTTSSSALQPTPIAPSAS
jgi:hypothetical protein